jgi:vancomycin resistance protein VanJ
VKHKKSIALNTVAGVFGLFMLLGWNVALFRPTTSGTRLRVMTYNIYYGGRKGIDAIIQTVNSESPDILCVQEVSVADREGAAFHRLSNLFAEATCAGRGSMAIFSRYPIMSVSSKPLNRLRDILRVTVRVNEIDIDIQSVHFLTSERSGNRRRRNTPLPGYLLGALRVRSQQAETLIESIGMSARPSVIAGDFNTPPRGEAYRRIAGEYVDAFRAAGWGAGYTFRSDLPIMRIDYVFVRGLAVERCYVRNSKGSDHLPVVADLLIEE